MTKRRKGHKKAVRGRGPAGMPRKRAARAGAAARRDRLPSYALKGRNVRKGSRGPINQWHDTGGKEDSRSGRMRGWGR